MLDSPSHHRAHMGNPIGVVDHLARQPHGAADAAAGCHPHLDAELLHHRRCQADRALLVMIMTRVIVVTGAGSGAMLAVSVLRVAIIALGVIVP